MFETVPTPALVFRWVHDPVRFRRQEYLQCQEPLTWSARRVDAQVFSTWAEADELARELTSEECRVFAAIPETATTRAETVPAQHRRRNVLHEVPHDWREDAPNCGVL